MTERTEQAAMLIRFFNMMTGAQCRTGNEWNQRRIIRMIDIAEGNVAEVKGYIKKWSADNAGNKDLNAMADSFECDHAMPTAPQAPAQTTAQVTDNQVQYSMSILEQAVVQLISKTQAERIESEIMGQIENKVNSFIKEEYGTIERKIITVVDDHRAEMKGIQHEKFETILKFVSNNEPVFLTGPAGSGKNVLCKQVAEALGLKFYFTNAVTQEYKLTGFTDAMGTYQATQFYKAFTEGGVFMLDEMDASIPEVLVILNAAIANRYFDFPAPIGYTEAHPDFRVIAAGNTIGYGADYEYVGRNQLDAASLDRFAMVNIDYSPAIESAVTNGDTELLQFCRDFRKAAKDNGLHIIVSYRAMGRLAKMLQILTTEEALETCLIKGLEKDDLQMISNKVRAGKYKTAIENILARM